MGESDNSDQVDPLEARPDVWYKLGDEYKNNYAVELSNQIKYYKSRRGAANRVRKQYNLKIDNSDPLEARPDVWYELGDEYKNNYAVEFHDETRYYKTRRGAAKQVQEQYNVNPSQDQAAHRKRRKNKKSIRDQKENKNDLLNGSL